MRRIMILATLFFVALFIGSWVEARDFSPDYNLAVLQVEVQRDYATISEATAPTKNLYNFMSKNEFSILSALIAGIAELQPADSYKETFTAAGSDTLPHRRQSAVMKGGLLPIGGSLL